jgi:hypothetical protein
MANPAEVNLKARPCSVLDFGRRAADGNRSELIKNNPAQTEEAVA